MIRILALFAVIISGGCSTIPSSPAPHAHKYAIQILEVDVPVELPATEYIRYKTKPHSDSHAIEELIIAPDAKVHEHPIVYAEVGVPIILDQTKPRSFVEDFMIEGGSVKTKKKDYQLGTRIEVTLNDVDRELVSFRINVSTKQLKGYDTIEAADKKVKMPVFSEKQIDTDLQYAVNAWASLGSIDGTSHGDKNDFRKHYAIKVIPPAN
jgi:hypothetical protein